MDALLGAVWLYAKDVPRSVAFYRDAVGLPLVEEEGADVAHFDSGNIRISIHPWNRDGLPGVGGFYVFIVDDIDREVEELSSRGVEFKGGVMQDVYGRTAEFHDPDGHELYLWQLPRKGEPEYAHVETLAEHFARLRAALGR